MIGRCHECVEPVCFPKEGEYAGVRVSEKVEEDERVDGVEHCRRRAKPSADEGVRGG